MTLPPFLKISPKFSLLPQGGGYEKSKKIVILASGKNKADAVSKLLDNAMTTSCPATMLKTHPDVILICDKDAYIK